MRKQKRNTKLWLYLYQNGILQTGDEQRIAEAKLDYWRIYDANLKRSKRALKRTFSISFPPGEIQYIRKRAKDYDATVIDYVKLLVKADLSHSSPLENIVLLKEIFQILHYYINTIQDIEERETKNWLGINRQSQVLSKIIESVEREILRVIKKKS